MNNPELAPNGTEEARAIVSRLGWLSRTPERFRHSVLHKSQLLKFGAGANLYAAGDPVGGIYGLVSGRLCVLLAPNDLFPSAVHLFVPGTWTGEAAAITGEQRLVGLSATRATQVLYLPLVAVNAILNEDPQAYRSFARLGHLHLAAALGAVGDLMIRDPAKRLIALLLRLSGYRYESPPDVGLIDIDLRQDDLAIMSNVGRTKANTILSQLQAAEEIEVHYRRVRVLAPEALRARLSRDDVISSNASFDFV
jgi:CRP/FNR family transcriptional regulator, cyclic AMP receptor protein